MPTSAPSSTRQPNSPPTTRSPIRPSSGPTCTPGSTWPLPSTAQSSPALAVRCAAWPCRRWRAVSRGSAARPPTGDASMPIQVLMPALSPTMEKGNLAKWHKKEGDAVKSGDVIAEIETDKATMEVEAVDEGTLGKILVPEGTNDVAVNTPIAMILGEGEDASALTDGGGATRQQKATVTAPPAKVEQPALQVNRAPAPANPQPAAPPPLPSPPEPDLPEGTEMVTMTVREALRDAMAEEMRRDKTVFVMGEEVAEYQGAYKVTQGLLQEF